MAHSRLRLSRAVNLEQLAVLPWDFQVAFKHQRYPECPHSEHERQMAPALAVAAAPANLPAQPSSPPGSTAAHATKDLSAHRYAELYALLTKRSGNISAFSEYHLVKKEEIRQVPRTSSGRYLAYSKSRF